MRGGRRSSRPACAASTICARFPFTEKGDLRDAYPYGMLAIPRERCVRLHASSGTTGRPTVVGYSAQDIATWGDLMARSLLCRRRAARRHHPQRLRLRAVHRRAGRALRRRAAGLHGRAHVGRLRRAPGPAHPRVRRPGRADDAVLHAGDRRRVRAAGRRSARHGDAHRHLRRRALDRGHARGDRAAARHRCRRHLRPERGDGPGRRLRVRREQGRANDLGGSFLSWRSSIP